MIRTSRIPPLLSRICDENITSAFFLTTDGELLGYYSSLPNNAKEQHLTNDDNGDTSSKERKRLNPSSIGALISVIAEDYKRIGKGFSTGTGGEGLDMNCLLIEMELGLVGVVDAGQECLVVAIANRNVAMGLLKARLMALSGYVRESLTQLATPQL